ncbi:MAG: hypothetical protein ACP5HM_03835 [Anaerolineae bacterium]
MSQQKTGRKIKHLSWVLWGLFIVLGVLLFAAFSRAWALQRALREKEARLQPMLTAQAHEHATLEAQLTYVQSEGYVEAWAREEAKMVYPGETLVVPLLPTATATPTPAPTYTPTPTPTPQAFWRRWWDQLRGR